MRGKGAVASDSSSEDEDMSKFAQAAVTVESLAKDQQVVASKVGQEGPWSSSLCPFCQLS